MAWIDLGLSVLAVVGVVLIPGLLASFALGFRGLAAVALAAPAGTTVIVLASIAAPMLGLPWGALPVAIVALGILGVIIVLRLTLLRSRAARPVPRALSRAGVLALIGAVLIAIIQFLIVIGAPDNFSQTFDNIFHLNAIRYALDTASASPLTVGAMTTAPSGNLPFYPTGWHAVAALAVQLTGASIPVASNAVMIFFGAFVWPVSMLLLTRSLFGASTPVLVTGAAVSVALPAYPLLLVEYGVLFPYMMALSMIAVPVAFIIDASAMTIWTQRWVLLLGAAGTVPAIAIAHPSGLVALLLFVALVLAVRWVQLMRSEASSRSKIIATVAILVLGALLAVAWYVLRPSADARTWGTTETVGQAVGEVLTVSVWAAPVNLVVAALVAVGAVVAVRRRSASDMIALSFLFAAAALYIVVSALPYALPRDMLTGVWYNNAPRLAALLPMTWVPLAAIGGHRLWTLLSPRLARMSPRLARGVGATVAVLVLVVVPQAATMRQAVASAQGAFAVTDGSRLVTTDELALLERLDAHVPEDAVILGSPWTGTALAYALADRQVVMPHTLMDVTEDMSVVLDRLDSARPSDALCGALDRLGAEYVLDFGEQEINDGVHVYRGLDRLESSDAVEEVDAVGDAVLYEIVLCD
ncbi:hypothetical protein M4D51_06190 [Microbacterium sp. p3-SID338]|uniref:DUF6541 family protein n=1 Tax=unclassified Microbacterium TaxID=2609290 RepID=UPI000C80AC3A|nr:MULTISPECIES: DUF6541 family protein [unclassified Microbacterium]MCT1395312.1 hypothetical protein [Microbacterium sp. p3-SID338]PMC06950.1 hypothetical protein CJ226_03250 [Microbacterium sp. UMB0228]